MNNYKAHQEMCEKVQKRLCKEYPKNIRIFPRHVGSFVSIRVIKDLIVRFASLTISDLKGIPRVSINKKGMADLYGIYSENGLAIHFEIEIKTGKATQTKDQKMWQGFCKMFDIPHSVIRSEIEAVNFVETNIRKKINAATLSGKICK